MKRLWLILLVIPLFAQITEKEIIVFNSGSKLNGELISINLNQKINPNTSSELTTRFKHMIQSVDGEKDQKTIDTFVDDEFLALDARAFRKYRDEIEPDVVLKFDYTSQTGGSHKIDIPLGIEFFWPAAE